MASGFSHTTCLPAASTARTCSKCRWLGVVRWTTSTAGSASIASKLGYGAGRPAVRAFSAARSGLEPTMPVTSTPSRRSASTWTTPMKPVPTTAALISRMSLTPPTSPTGCLYS